MTVHIMLSMTVSNSHGPKLDTARTGQLKTYVQCICVARQTIS